MKKILVITPFYHPHLGGVEKHVRKVNQLLDYHKYQITVITSYQPTHAEIATHHVPVVKTETIDGIPVWRIRWPKVKLLGLLVFHQW